MLNDHSRGYLQSCCYSKQLSMALLLHASHPAAQTCRGHHVGVCVCVCVYIYVYICIYMCIYMYIYLIFPGH